MKKVTLWQGFQIFIFEKDVYGSIVLGHIFAVLINDLGLVKALLCLLIPGMFDKILSTTKSVVIIVWPLTFNTKDQPE